VPGIDKKILTKLLENSFGVLRNKARINIDLLSWVEFPATAK